MISVAVLIETQFYDLDPMGVVWHGHYARFFEQARCRLLEKIGYGYIEMEASGYHWPVVDMQIKYVGPLRFPQQVTVTATILESANRLKITYVIADVNGVTLTKASTTQVAVHRATGELCLESPAALTDKIRQAV